MIRKKKKKKKKKKKTEAKQINTNLSRCLNYLDDQKEEKMLLKRGGKSWEIMPLQHFQYEERDTGRSYTLHLIFDPNLTKS